MARLSIPEYVMALAHVAALRSEDPYRKVGAAALDADNRVIGTAYNGLYPGFTAPADFWASRDERQKFMLHAEINLCSLFKRGEARIVACTTMPCTSCMQALCAHGVKIISTRCSSPACRITRFRIYLWCHSQRIREETSNRGEYPDGVIFSAFPIMHGAAWR